MSYDMKQKNEMKWWQVLLDARGEPLGDSLLVSSLNFFSSTCSSNNKRDKS